MAFPIIPKKRSGATGNPASLTLGELAVNTLTGELFLGADAGVTLLNGPVAAGTTVTEATGDGATTAFTFSGYNGTADGGYLVSVGGIDQPPSTYSISATAGGTITFSAAPTAGELISIRAIIAGSGGGGGSGIGGRAWSAAETYTEGDLVATSQREAWICIQAANTNHDPTTSPLWWQPMPADAVSLQLVPVATTTPTTGQGLVYNGTAWAPSTPQANATQIQSRNVATTAPTAGQVLAWSATNSRWQPTSLNGSVNFNTPGTHTWAVPAWARWVYVSATAGSGGTGTGTNGANGNAGASAYYDTVTQTWVNPTTGSNGADGTAADGAVGKSISIAALSLTIAGGAGGAAGIAGLGGGGSGGGGGNTGDGYIDAANGASGTGYYGGGAGNGATAAPGGGTGGHGGGSGGNGSDGNNGYGGNGGSAGAYNGGAGGSGGGGGSNTGGGGGGGGDYSSGGGGGGGSAIFSTAGIGEAGTPGYGGLGAAGTAGAAGETFSGPQDVSSFAGSTLSIVISEGEGTASITITY